MLPLVLSWILALLGRRSALRRGCVHAGRKAVSRAPVLAAALAMLDPNGCHRAGKQHRSGRLCQVRPVSNAALHGLSVDVGVTVDSMQRLYGRTRTKHSLRRSCKAIGLFHALRPLSCEPLARAASSAQSHSGLLGLTHPARSPDRSDDSRPVHCGSKLGLRRSRLWHRAVDHTRSSRGQHLCFTFIEHISGKTLQMHTVYRVH